MVLCNIKFDSCVHLFLNFLKVNPARYNANLHALNLKVGLH